MTLLRGIIIYLLSWCAINANDLLSIGETVPEIPSNAVILTDDEMAKIYASDTADSRLLLLYFAKSGCPSCDEFAPHLARLLLKYEDEMRALIVIPGMYPQSEAAKYAAERTLSETPIIYDAGKNFAPRFIGKIDKFPYVALVANDGKLCWYGRAKFHEQITDEVERALGKKTVANATTAAENFAAIVIGAKNARGLYSPLLSPEFDSTAIAKTLSATDNLINDAAQLTAENILSKVREITASKVLLFFSGEAKARKIDDEKTDLLLQLPHGEISLTAIAATLREKYDAENAGSDDAPITSARKITFIIDACQEDGLKYLDEKRIDDKLFGDIVAEFGRALPDATIILSAARWDKSLLAEKNRGGTLFAKFLNEELTENKLRAPEELWRNLRDKMANVARRTGELQSPFIANP